MRRRSLLLLALAGVVVAGLALQLVRELPFADLAGTVLYAAAVHLVVCLVAPGVRAATVAGVALAVCVAIELLQLTPLPSALAAAFRPAALLLGTTFAWPDLLAYAVGVGIAYAIDQARPPPPGRQ